MTIEEYNNLRVGDKVLHKDGNIEEVLMTNINIHILDGSKRWEDGILYGNELGEVYARTKEDFIKSFSVISSKPADNPFTAVTKYPEGEVTSFHQCTIKASLKNLYSIFGGKEFNAGPTFDGKVRNQFAAYYEYSKESRKIFFTVYDWKEYRDLRENEDIYWHIGTNTREDSKLIKDILTLYINYV